MKMRKALSFVLVLALVLGSFSMVFAADGVKQGSDLSDISGNANYDAIVANSDLGIITGYDDGSYKPANAVNRAEFAAMITRMMGVPDSALAGYASTNFTDMSGYGWAGSYVGFCAAKGIVNGYGDGTFGPGNTITVNEAVTMVLRAVGYVSNSSELVGTWPSNYVTLGKRLGIYDDVASTTTIDRANAAQVIYNALTAVVVAVNADGDTKAAYTTGSGDNYYEKNVLEVYLDCTLYGDADDLDKDGFGVYPYEAAQDSVVNTMGYVGAYVKAFKNDDGDVVAIAESKSTFLTGKYDVDDEEFKVGDTVYTLTDKNMEKARMALLNMKDVTPLDKDKKADIDAASVDKDAPATGLFYDAGVYPNDTGSVTLAVDVSGKTIKEVYSISKWYATDAVFYEKDMLEDDNLYGYDFDLDNDKIIDNSKFQLNGATALSNIEEDNIVEIFTVGVDKNKDIVRVDVGTKTVPGKITMIDGSDYTIGGTVYSKADKIVSNEKDALPAAADKAGDTGIAYLSFRGDIAGWELENAASDNYAVISGVYKAVGRDNTLMLVDKTGTEKEYVVKDNDKTLDAVTALKDDEVTKATLGKFVTFSLDKNGKINELNVVTDNVPVGAVLKDNTGSDFAGDNELNKNRTVLDNTKVDSGVIVFTYDDNDLKKADFSVIKLSDLETEKALKGTYYYAKDGKIKAMLVSDKFTGAESIYAVINKITTAVNDDDDDVLYVEGYANGAKFKKYTDDAASAYEGLTGLTIPMTDPNATGVDITATVYKLSLNASGIITDIEKVTDDGKLDDTAKAVYGEVQDKSGNNLIQVKDSLDSDEVKWLTLDSDTVKVYTFNKSDNEFSASKLGDIYSLKSGNKDASTVKVWQVDDDSDVYDVVVIYKDGTPGPGGTTFTAQTATIANKATIFGFLVESAASTDSAIVDIDGTIGNSIVLKSASEGEATIVVEDTGKTKTAYIEVTVAKNGSITYTIVK